MLRRTYSFHDVDENAQVAALADVLAAAERNAHTHNQEK
jgi:hypothetical protein